MSLRVGERQQGEEVSVVHVVLVRCVERFDIIFDFTVSFFLWEEGEMNMRNSDSFHNTTSYLSTPCPRTWNIVITLKSSGSSGIKSSTTWSNVSTIRFTLDVNRHISHDVTFYTVTQCNTTVPHHTLSRHNKHNSTPQHSTTEGE